MSDLNTFFVSGRVDKITADPKGFSNVIIKVFRETQRSSEDIIVPIAYWGDKTTGITTGDYVIASGYIKSRMVAATEKRPEFPATSLIGNTIRKISAPQMAKPMQQAMNFNDADAPF